MGDSIDVRSRNVLATIEAHIRVAMIVSHYDDEVRTMMISEGDSV